MKLIDKLCGRIYRMHTNLQEFVRSRW